MNYKVIGSVTGLVTNRVYAREEIEKHPGLGGVARLVGKGAIEETSEMNEPTEDDGDNSTGSPPPLGQDENAKLAHRQQRGGDRGDAAARANRATGEPGEVVRRGPGRPPKAAIT